MILFRFSNSFNFDFEAYIHTLSQENMLTYAKSKDFKVLKLKLKNSFLNCKNYLLDILKNDPEYKAILAKEEIKDEIAYQYFLIEQNYTLKQFFDNDSKELIQNLLKATNLFLKEFDP